MALLGANKRFDSDFSFFSAARMTERKIVIFHSRSLAPYRTCAEQ